jgi:hypothetical protein
MKKIKISTEYFHGCISVETTKKGLKPWRIRENERLLFPSPNDNFLKQSEQTSGVRLRLRTNSKTLVLVVAPTKANRAFDLVSRGDILQTLSLDAGKSQVTFEGLKGKLSTYEIWLDPANSIEVKGFEVENKSTCSPAKDRRKRWVTYGSSITHCGGSLSPAKIWAGVAARELDLNLTSLGYGGQCHVDPMMARTIRDTPADLISLKLGINVYGRCSLNDRSFVPALIGTVMTIREKHPKTPILLISPVCSPQRESKENDVGMTLQIMRTQMQDAMKRIKKSTGDENLFYLSGLKLANASFAEIYMPDQLHPNGEGYVKMGKHFVKYVPKEIRASLDI